MNSEQIPLQPIPPSVRVPPMQARRRYIPNLTSWLVGAFVLVILVLGIFPACGCGGVQVKGMQTKSLAQARQIGLALRVFADDHGGDYPRAGLPAMAGAEVKDANAAFAVLFPDYLTSEALFANAYVHGSHRPDNDYDNPYTGRPIKTLAPGENVYSYVAGLTIRSDPHAPLVADGTDGTGHYTTDTQKPGGVWAGRKAVVVYLDNSGALESLVGPEHSRYIPRHPGEPGQDGGNRLDVSILGPDVRLLDPAVSR